MELILCIVIVSPEAQLKACPSDPGCGAQKYTGWDSFVRRIPDVSFYTSCAFYSVWFRVKFYTLPLLYLE